MEIETLDGLPPTITVEQAGEMLGICRRTAYRAAQRGQIPTMRIGRRLFVPTARLLAMLGITENGESQTPVGPPAPAALTSATYEVSGDEIVGELPWPSEQTS